MPSSERFPSWVLGYTDELTVRPGETAVFRVSGAGADEVETQLVRLIHGDTRPRGPGFRELEVSSSVGGRYRLTEQESHSGSYGRIPEARAILPPSSTAVSLFAMLQPCSSDGEQALMSAWDCAAARGIALVLEPGRRLALWLSGDTSRERVGLAEPLAVGVWYAVCGSWNPGDGSLVVQATPVINSYNSRFGPVCALRGGRARSNARGPEAWPNVDLLLGALDARDGRVVRGTLNGKLALPCVYGRALSESDLAALARSGSRPAIEDGLEGWWDLSQEIASMRLVGGRADSPSGTLVNAPTRAVTAHNWDGSCYVWTDAPSQYGAVHFHDDDVDDVGWEATCSLPISDELQSGVYALRLRVNGFEDHVPFFVGAPSGRESPIALVVPTASYMAYANEHEATRKMVQAPVGHTPSLQPMDLLLMEHPELGLSMYDVHSDGSGVSISSRRRPILNMRPRHLFSMLDTWQFPSDLYIVDWLEHNGYAYDVVTDEDLHRAGPAALRPYRVALTGTHPEYTSERMLDAYEQYIAGGGNVMYLGGNGFYWVISYHADRPWLMEVRRGHAGVRAWESAPGEEIHSTTGERGGLWRDRGRPPQKIFGTGFTAEGHGGSSYYHRMPDSGQPEMRWIFDGVRSVDRIGDYGLVGGGASGQEIDRADVALGTPPHTYLLASAQDQNDSYKGVPEDHGAILDGLGGTEHPYVRADMTYFESPGGGAVFATSSIAWAGSLSHNEYDNDISRITGNVLDRLSDR
jgi:N,N-dimethylformamidase